MEMKELSGFDWWSLCHRTLITGKPLHFLFCIGSRFINSGHRGSTRLTVLFNVQLATRSNRRTFLYLSCLPTAVSFWKGRRTTRRELLKAITNCHSTRVGERHKLVCVYSLTDPLIPATPVRLLCPNLSGGLTGPGWQMGRRGQSSVGSVERLRPRV